MGRIFKQIKIDDSISKAIEENKKRLKSIGIPDRLLTNNKVLRFMNEKAKRNNRLIPLEEVLEILGG